MDFARAALYFLLYEALTLPLRAALCAGPAPADVRRVLSSVAGPVLLLLPLAAAAHAGAGWLARGVGLGWAGLLLALALATVARGLPAARVLGYRDAAPGRFARPLALDALTLALFLGFVALRRWIPEMATPPIESSGAEKFMNMMIFWSSWHAGSLPPDDYWLAGHPLAYYYGGHLHWAWIGRTGGFAPESAVTLALARAVTLVFEAGYLLARAFGARPGVSAAAALTAAWAGNPSAVAGLWRAWRPAGGFAWSAYDFWKPSRAIADSVISEFPAFSALLGDFHAHHLALPWMLGWLAVLSAGGRWLVGAGGAAGWLTAAVVGWGLALAAALANLWNLPLIGFALALALARAALRGWRASARALALAVPLALLLALSARALLGPGAQPLPLDASAGFWASLPIRRLPIALRSTPPQLFAMWGLPVLALGLASLARALTERRRRVAIASALGGGLVLVGAAAGAPLILWAALACWIASLAAAPRRWLSQAAARMLLAVCALLAGLELAFVDDAYAGVYERYNSYFKLSYPVWVPLVLGAFLAGARLWSAAPRVARAPLRAALLALLAAGAVYPVCAAPARLLRARAGDAPPRRPGLDAVEFLAHRPPYDEEAPMLAWIRAHVPPAERVAEGVGRDAYGYVGRVASLAGRPVPLGWAHHERQWRGVAGHALTRERARELDALYRARTPEALRERAGALGVHWVLFGRVERERYGDPAADPGVLAPLRGAGAVAAAFPSDRPTVFLFDLRRPPR